MLLAILRRVVGAHRLSALFPIFTSRFPLEPLFTVIFQPFISDLLLLIVKMT